MRKIALLILLLATPTAAVAQLAPRSLSLEAGLAHHASDAGGDRIPIGLSAAWWLIGDLEATARVAWTVPASAGRRGESFEAGAGLRRTMWSAHRVRPVLGAEASIVQVPRALAVGGGAALRVMGSAAVEAFLLRDVSLSLVGGVGVLAGAGGAGLTASGLLRTSAYF
jgi:hypothetical protein